VAVEYLDAMVPDAAAIVFGTWQVWTTRNHKK